MLDYIINNLCEDRGTIEVFKSQVYEYFINYTTYYVLLI